jgi:hypothetical protein
MSTKTLVCTTGLSASGRRPRAGVRVIPSEKGTKSRRAEVSACPHARARACGKVWHGLRVLSNEQGSGHARKIGWWEWVMRAIGLACHPRAAPHALRLPARAQAGPPWTRAIDGVGSSRPRRTCGGRRSHCGRRGAASRATRAARSCRSPRPRAGGRRHGPRRRSRGSAGSPGKGCESVRLAGTGPGGRLRTAAQAAG